jgi:flagellar basal-body rod protein FlgG
MFDALQIAATGMQAQQKNVDAIANNLANVNTPGYRKAKVAFTELVAQSAAPASRADMTEVASSEAMRGAGVAVATLGRSFELGEVMKTEGALDVAIEGDGFIEVLSEDGGRAYVRGGTLRVNADGLLTTASGLLLRPGMHVPADTEALVITDDGRVQVKTSRAGMHEIGQLELARFVSTSGLEAVGGGVFIASERSGQPISGRAAQDGFGKLRQGFLEGSNVKMVDEMVNLMIAQRAYEASVKVIQASDEMLGMVNGMRK